MRLLLSFFMTVQNKLPKQVEPSHNRFWNELFIVRTLFITPLRGESGITPQNRFTHCPFYVKDDKVRVNSSIPS